MNFQEAIGILAGTLTTIAFVPQVYKTYRSKSAKDLSLGMFLIFFTGVVCWLLYGIIIHNWPIIISNFFVVLLSATLLSFKFIYKD
jgi:MtN3 and saliva related transmembrane protein